MIKFFSLFTCVLLVTACGPKDLSKTHGVIELSEQFSTNINLVDFDGNAVTTETYAGQTLFIYVGFASCPDVCPNALSVMSASLEAMGRSAQNVTPLFITIDPERDSPEILKAHLAFDPRITGLTGTQENIDNLTKGLFIYAKKVATEESAMGYTMDHSSMFYVINPEGAPIYALIDDMAPKEIASALKAML